jgi:glutamate carboxypeptidase
MADASIHTHLQTYLEQNRPLYLDLLRQMVAINTFTANKKGVNDLGKLTADLFTPLGFTAEYIESINPQFGRHVILTSVGKSKRKIGLISHLDTVFPPDEEIHNNFVWRIEGDRIYGPGTVDIKGGTVVIYMMLAVLQAVLPEVYDEITWVLLLDASEEVDGEDFSRICLEKLRGDETLACLVFEGGHSENGNNKIVVARKGMVMTHITVEGKAAHAGSAHENGANAVVQLADVIQRLNSMTDYSQGLTVNVGTVQGGTVSNRVPHFAESRAEMRAFSPEVFQKAFSEILALRDLSTVQSVNGGYGCWVEIEVTRKTAPWPRNEATDRLLGVWQEAASELGMQVTPEERGGLSDGNYIWDKLPVLDGLGPSGRNAHCSEHYPEAGKEQEYCLISSFVPKAMLNITAVLKLIANT